MTEQQFHTVAGLTLVSRFFYQTFHQAPSTDFIHAIYQESLIEQWPLDVNNDALAQGLVLLKQQPDMAAINQDFADLFIGPNALKAAPWASVYLTEEQTLFGAPTAAIKQFYLQFGVEIDTGEHEPDDHIGLIFSFIAHLCEMALQQDIADDQPSPLLCALEKFLAEHVLTWAPRMLHIMRDEATTDFYKGMSLAAEGTLRQLAHLTKADYRIVRLYR